MASELAVSAAAHAGLAGGLASALSSDAPKNAGSQRAAASLGSRLASAAMEMALADETRDAAERYAASLWRQGGLTRRGSGTEIAIASVKAALNLDDDSLALLEREAVLQGRSTTPSSSVNEEHEESAVPASTAV